MLGYNGLKYTININWRRKWQSTPGQRSLVGYSSWGQSQTRLNDTLTLIPPAFTFFKWRLNSHTT